MSRVRVLVGTRKGAFILTADGKRDKWEVSGPHFAGWELYHLKGSTADPNRIYASQTSGWFGQVIQRSDDGGKTWHQPGTPPGETKGPDGMPKGESNKFVYDTAAAPLTTHQFYDGTQHPWEFKRVWHLEPSLTDPDTVYAGVEDAALFRSTDGGKNWKELPGLRGHGTGPKWQPGAGGMCLHTIILDPKDPNRIYIAISAAGAFRTDDGGKSWKPINKGLFSKYIPDPNAEIGHCVHHVAMVDFGKGAVVPFPVLLEELFQLIAEDAAHFGCIAEVAHARMIVQRGTSADRQLARYDAIKKLGGSEQAALVGVVDEIVEETLMLPSTAPAPSVVAAKAS